MFFANVGQPSDVDVFAFYLAEKLGRTLSDLDDMPASEYASWQSYYKVQQQQRDLAVKAARRG